jgi:small subunit ribosomal protein S6
MMYRYEALLLTVPEITQDEFRSLESELDRLVRSAKGTLLSFERWGKFRLAYPVRRNEYGVYCLVRFELPDAQQVLDAIKSLFSIKLHDIVMRSMISRLDFKKSLAYQRPKSLEETPSRDVGTFFKGERAGDLVPGESMPEEKDAEQIAE